MSEEQCETLLADVRLILQVTHPLLTFGLLVRVFFSFDPVSGGESLLDREPLGPFCGHAGGKALRSGSICTFGALIDQAQVTADPSRRRCALVARDDVHIRVEWD